MPTTEIVKTAAPAETYDKLHSTTGDEVTMAAADVANGNHIASSGDLLLLAHNTSGSSATITITSQPDPRFGRSGDVSAQTIAAGEIRRFRLTSTGWANTDGNIEISCSAVGIELGGFDLN